MKVQITQMTILYPNGARQVVKPNPSFQGNWNELAEAIARPYYPLHEKIKYELK